MKNSNPLGYRNIDEARRDIVHAQFAFEDVNRVIAGDSDLEETVSHAMNLLEQMLSSLRGLAVDADVPTSAKELAVQVQALASEGETATSMDDQGREQYFRQAHQAFLNHRWA